VSLSQPPPDELARFIASLLAGKLARRVAIIARWLLRPPAPAAAGACGGGGACQALVSYFATLLFEPAVITMHPAGLSLFKGEGLTIANEWLLRAERNQFIYLFMQRDTLFSKMETFVGDRFILSQPKTPASALLPQRTRLVLVRDSFMYIERFNAELRPLLLAVTHRLILEYPVCELIHRIEYALQRGIPLGEVIVD
jgi:hypothetical protein